MTPLERRVLDPVPPEDTGKALVKLKEVKDGVAETAMVEVPETTMLLPWVNKLPMSE